MQELASLDQGLHADAFIEAVCIGAGAGAVAEDTGDTVGRSAPGRHEATMVPPLACAGSTGTPGNISFVSFSMGPRICAVSGGGGEACSGGAWKLTFTPASLMAPMSC